MNMTSLLIINELSRTMERVLLSLTRAFTRVQNPNIRKIIIELVRSV
ncbi:hypothetical protein RAT170B_0453 [Rickettsia argasii T170-B]|uniref:Uncharacterized protein n=1 Tax=Rickettsia argasii T170-B TaxID=1268837 RepID=A0A0F3RI29_9RICK|nr:hypothetical protein RAT170B_0453 [Rickettsia argasii T170-B]